MQWNGDKIAAEIDRIAARRLVAAAVYLTGKVKEVLSVPAPRQLVKSPRGNFYRATVDAKRGAPPRKLSGRLRASMTYQVLDAGKRVRIGTNVIYARRHELGFPKGHAMHPFLKPTLFAERAAIERILAA